MAAIATIKVSLENVDPSDMAEHLKTQGFLVYPPYSYTGSLIKRCLNEVTEDQLNEALKEVLNSTRKQRGLSAV